MKDYIPLKDVPDYLNSYIGNNDISKKKLENKINNNEETWE